MEKYVIRNNGGQNITHRLDENDYTIEYDAMCGTFIPDKVQALRGLEELVNSYPDESSMPGGFTVELIPDVKPVVMARYTKNKKTKKIDKGLV